MASMRAAGKQKKIIRITIWLLQKKLGKTVNDMANDLKHCGNPVFQELYYILLETVNNNESTFQRETTYQVGITMLWILYKDTGYKDPSYWGLAQLLLKAPELLTTLSDGGYLKPPKKWACNVWDRSRKRTKMLQERGDIPKNAKSLDEDIFVPGIQKRKLEKL
jgi:hypothetical protein